MTSVTSGLNLIETSNHPKARLCRDCRRRHIYKLYNAKSCAAREKDKYEWWCERCRAFTGCVFGIPEPWYFKESKSGPKPADSNTRIGPKGFSVKPQKYHAHMRWKDWAHGAVFTDKEQSDSQKKVLAKAVMSYLNNRVIEDAERSIMLHVRVEEKRKSEPQIEVEKKVAAFTCVVLVIYQVMEMSRTNKKKPPKIVLARIANKLGVSRNLFYIREDGQEPPLLRLTNGIERVLNLWDKWDMDKKTA